MVGSVEKKKESIEERKRRLLAELGDVEEFLKEERIVKQDFPKDTVFDGRLEPLGGGRYSFSGSVKHPDGGVLEFENAVLEKTDKGYAIQGTTKGLVGWIPLDEEVKPATREDIKEHARVSEDYEVKGEPVGRLYKLGNEQVLVDDKHKVIARGEGVTPISDGYWVRASKDGRIKGVIEVGDKTYKTKNRDEVLFVAPDKKVVARGWGVDVEDGGYRVKASEDVPGVVEVGGKKYEIYRDFEQLFVDPKTGVVARGWKIDVRDDGYLVKASRDGSIKGVIEINGKKYKTEKPWEELLVVPEEKFVARGLGIYDVGTGYDVTASRDGSVPALVEIDGMHFENNDKGLQILKPNEFFSDYRVKPLRGDRR